MTVACPGPNCVYCSSLACRACAQQPRDRNRRCAHDTRERHSGMPAVDERRTVAVQPLLTGRVEVDLADGENAAEFLELVAKIIRAKKRVVLVVE